MERDDFFEGLMPMFIATLSMFLIKFYAIAAVAGSLLPLGSKLWLLPTADLARPLISDMGLTTSRIG